MKLQPILVFDFDGVIVDGLLEYWDSARKTSLNLLGKNYYDTSSELREVPDYFRELRPWVKDGWEMVLLAAEIMRKDSPLVIHGSKYFAKDYEKNRNEALIFWKWQPKQLQIALNHVRKQAIKDEKQAWLELHRAYSGVVERIQQLVTNEKIDFAVLTTKSTQFTSELLNHLNLHPTLLYGHEAGNKTDLLLHISKKNHIQGFIEDRRATLETVIKTPGINSIPCYLANWGYLKPEDTNDLPEGIKLLKPEILMSPLAQWP